MTTGTSAPIEALLSRLPNQVLRPGDEGYDDARQAWDLVVDQHPAVIVRAQDTRDVVLAVRAASDAGLRVAVQSTGHGLAAPADNALLILTSAMRDMTIDSTARTAWIGAGVQWGTVLEAAQQAGLAPLLGSSPVVGAVGYTLGGGFGWLGRKYGLSLDHVLEFEIVTADGAVRTANADSEPDLFWALRGGGGGSLGVVTAMRIDLVPVTTVYAGSLLYPAEQAPDVITRWREWIPTVPDELTSAVVLMNFPPIDMVPEPLRGQSFAIVRGCHCGDLNEAEELMSYWRSWQAPVMDAFGPMPFTEAGMISQDPVDPVPALASTEWLRELSGEAIDALTAAAFPVNAPPPITFVEIRHVDGAVARASAESTAYGNRDGKLLLELISLLPSPAAAPSAQAALDDLQAALRPYVTGGAYLNFLMGDEKRTRTQAAFGDESWARIREIKAAVDPGNLFPYGIDLVSGTG